MFFSPLLLDAPCLDLGQYNCIARTCVVCVCMYVCPSVSMYNCVHYARISPTVTSSPLLNHSSLLQFGAILVGSPDPTQTFTSKNHAIVGLIDLPCLRVSAYASIQSFPSKARACLVLVSAAKPLRPVCGGTFVSGGRPGASRGRPGPGPRGRAGPLVLAVVPQMINRKSIGGGRENASHSRSPENS